jgi:pimeloyl-ACP methyl ester carboxylesterase
VDQFRRGPLTFDVRDGGPSDGEPVVLLHGFPQDKDAWLGIEPLLHAEGLRTLAPDQRGYSPGARPKGRRAYATTELIDDILALLDAAELESAHVVGHDWGAAVAWGLACNHPDRVRSLTALSVPHPRAFTEAATKSTQGLRSWYMLAFQLPWIPERFVGSPRLAGGLQRMGLPAESAEHNAERMGQPGAATAAINWYRALPFSLRTPVHRSSVPTTHVWSRGDSALGRYGAEATAKFVTGEYRFVEVDGTHWLPETQPAEMAAIIVDRVRSVDRAPAPDAA